jgi:NADPH:quinone reductase-like Zn-dependent oxidoreductase
MKAAVCRKYGPPKDVVQIEEIAKPVPKDDEVLIRVVAASVNPVDGMVKGRPYLIRMMSGLGKPREPGIGHDVAGKIEEVGRNITQFKPGDEVFGVCRGACAQYACASEANVVAKPANATFEQAASTPVAALTALQGLRDKGKIQAGQKVLINGAAGGVGTFAVQIAKSFGADVTAVCSTRNVEMLRSIGADHVVDYTREDFTKGGQRYDLFFDLASNHPLRVCRRLLKPGGVYVVGGVLGVPEGRPMAAVARMFEPAVMSRFVKEKMVAFIAKVDQADLRVIGELIANGKVKPMIDRRYSLSEVAEAMEYLGTRHARGKVIVTVDSRGEVKP